MSLLPRINKTFANVSFSKAELTRYSRHLMLPEVTQEGQQKLKESRVFVVGTGGLGSPLLMYLTAAGVGNIGIVDFDHVDESNLQRQIVHKTSNIGMPKIESAVATLREINPHVQFKTHSVALRSENALDLIRDYDIVVDGTDNFPARYLVNDACVLLGKPNVYGSIFRFEGQASVFWAEKGPCYRCVFPEPPDPGSVPSCAEAGVLGVLPGVIGTLQAIETIKIIIGQGEPLFGRLLLFDSLKMKFREVRLRKDPACPICGAQRTIRALIDYDQFCGVVPKPASGKESAEISVQDLKKAMDTGADFDLIDVREPFEFEIAKLPGAQLIPLGQISARLGELKKVRTLYTMCKMGGRSAKACQILRDAGFTKAWSVAGGIRAWSEKIDPSVPKY